MDQEPVSADEAEMPGYWRFIWMFFMQPITLHYRLRACGVTVPETSILEYLANRKNLHYNYKKYVSHSILILTTVPAFFATSFWIFAMSLHTSIPLTSILGGLLAGIATGLIISLEASIAIMTTFGMSSGIVFAILVVFTHIEPKSTTLTIAHHHEFSAAFNFQITIAFGIALGNILSIAGAVARGVTAPFGVSIFILLTCIIALATHITYPNNEFSPVNIAAFSLAVAFTFFRVPIYPFEVLWQIFINNIPVTNNLRFAPVLHHDFCYLPHPGLAKLIVATASQDPLLSHRAITAANRSPGQKNAAANAQAELAATEIATLASNARFTDIVELQGEWLPGQQTDSALLQSLSATARFMLAAQHASSPHLGLQHLDKAEAKLAAIDNQLPVSKEPLARFLPPTLRIWRTQLASMRAAALSASSHILPNPFMVSNPLSSETSWGQAVFRGREATIAQVETLLADQHNSTSIALIGPRRCGKSSLLNMLRVMLPDTIVVLFDLLGNPVNTPLAFYQALAKTAQEQARRFHQQNLPDLPPGEPIEALKQWFDLLEQFEGASRILICLDEFERLETLFPDQTRELPQLMGLLRATIQHRRRLRLLIAGAAPFDELGKLWNDHFINLREIRLGYLDQANTCALLHAPIPEFPASAIPLEVAQQVYARSRGQPFLAQVYGHTLIETLNREQRQCATLADIEQIEPEMLQSYSYYFNGIWQDLPAPAQAAMQALAQAGTQDAKVEMDKPTQKWLRRRLLIDEHGHMLVPLFGRWVRGKDEVE